MHGNKTFVIALVLAAVIVGVTFAAPRSGRPDADEENYYHTREVGKPGSNNVAMSVPDNEKTGNSLFDVVFAIPINIIQAVNKYLNQKQKNQLESAAAAQNGKPVSPPKMDYDGIFNIPIAVLKSVQNLLSWLIH